jgi:hypothetical protein
VAIKFLGALMAQPQHSPLVAHDRRMGMLDIECIDEIKRLLNKFRFDAQYRGYGNRVPWRQFSELCGVSRQTLYDLVRGDRKGIEPATRDRIFAALKMVLEQGVRWKRITVRKPVVERRVIAPGLIEWIAIMPDGTPAPLIPRKSFSEKQLAAHRKAAARAAAQRAAAT